MSILATIAATTTVFAWLRVVELRARVDDMEAWFVEAGIGPPVGPERTIFFPYSLPTKRAQGPQAERGTL